ncbi:hypothetical protein D3C72_2043000 [compost metagenome]
MRHGGAAVHDDPFAVVFAFDARLGEAGFFHRVAHAGSQSLGLAVGGARCHDHPFKQRREMLGVEDLDVLRLDVLQAINDGALEFGNVFFGGGFRFGGGGHQAMYRKGCSI